MSDETYLLTEKQVAELLAIFRTLDLQETLDAELQDKVKEWRNLLWDNTLPKVDGDFFAEQEYVPHDLFWEAEVRADDAERTAVSMEQEKNEMQRSYNDLRARLERLLDEFGELP
jgi:hypothetical protein